GYLARLAERHGVAATWYPPTLLRLGSGTHAPQLLCWSASLTARSSSRNGRTAVRSKGYFLECFGDGLVVFGDIDKSAITVYVDWSRVGGPAVGRFKI